MCGPMCCYSETLCVCFLRRYFPLTKHKTAVNCLNTSHHHWTLSIYSWLFPQLSHSSSLVNIHFPQMEMVLRKTAQALDPLCGQANWEPMGGPSVSSLPLTCTYCSAMILSHGARGSLHLRPCLEVLAAPEFQTHFKVGSVVMKPKATKGGLCFPKYLSP